MSRDSTARYVRRGDIPPKLISKLIHHVSLHPEEHLVKSSVINLVNILVTPLRCDHTIALAVTKLILCISNSVSKGKVLTSQQLQIVSGALIEFMTNFHEATGR